MKELYEASYEIEIRHPLFDASGKLSDLDFADNLINKVGMCHATEAGFGDRCAIGDAYFESFEDAYEWKLKTQAILDEKFPSTDARAFCGLNVYGLDPEENTYLEISEIDGEFFASNEVDIPLDRNEECINLTEDQFDIQKAESHYVSEEAKDLEAYLIAANITSIGR